MVNLNLGCGQLLMEDYVNVDIVPPENLNGHNFFAHDVRCRLPYDDGHVDLIYARHLIEHLTPAEWRFALTDWRRALKDGGLLTIECPDLKRCLEGFLSDKWHKGRWWYITIFGEPDEGMAHLQGFTMSRLVTELKGWGFKILSARPWNDKSGEQPMENYNIRVEAVKV